MRTGLPLAPRGAGVALLAVVAAALLPPSAGAQELGIALGRGASGLDELDRPSTLAVHAQLPVPRLPWLRVEGAWRRARERDRRAGTTCDLYWPRFEGCIEEPIEHDATLEAWEIGLGLGAEVLSGLELRGSVLRVSRRELDATSAGFRTRRSAGSFYPDGASGGLALHGGLVWVPPGVAHLGVLARVRHEELDFVPEGCVTDVGTPFCDASDLTTLELGIVVRR